MILEWQQMAVKVYTDGKIHSKIQSGLRLTNFSWQVDLYCSCLNPQTNLNVPDYPDTITVHTNDTEKALYFGGIYRKAQSTTSIGGKPYWIHAVRIGTLVAFGIHSQNHGGKSLLSFLHFYFPSSKYVANNKYFLPDFWDCWWIQNPRNAATSERRIDLLWQQQRVP